MVKVYKDKVYYRIGDGQNLSGMKEFVQSCFYKCFKLQIYYIKLFQKVRKNISY